MTTTITILGEHRGVWMDDLFVAVFVGTMVMSAVPVISVTIADVLKAHRQASYRETRARPLK